MSDSASPSGDTTPTATPAAPTAAPASAEPSAAPSLEQIASQFEPPAAPQPQATHVQQTPPVQSAPTPPTSMPDPKTQPDMYAAWQAEQFQAMQNQFNAQQQELQQQREQQQRQAEIGDINQAVGKIAAGIEQSNPKAIEGFLHYKYVNDPNFQKIWANRQTNSQAYETALSVLQQEYKNDFAQQVDPQLMENQRALQQSYQSAPSGIDPQSAEMQKWKDADEETFDREWHGLSHQYN